MARQYVFYNSQPEASAAGIAGAGLVYPVKTLGKALYMVCGYTFAIIINSKQRF